MSDFRNNLDPLELARQDLDFAAMAAAAPSIKDVMFKAQTMAPLPQPRRWERAAGGAGAAALALAIAFVPWLPSRTTYSVLNVQFEQTFQPEQAQKTVDSMLSALPGRMLLGAQYSRIGANTEASAGAADSSAPRGMLSLSVSSFMPQAEMERRINEVVSAKLPDIASPMISLTAELHDRDANGRIRRHSPAELLAQNFGSGSDEVEENLPGAALASELLENQQLFAGHLAEELSSSYFRLEDAHFISPGADRPLARNHFEVDSWPYPLSVQIENYRNLTATEQAEVKGSATRFFQRINLAQRGLALEAAAAVPEISVSVYGLSGAIDLYSTEKLSALVREALAAAATPGAASVEGAVSEGVATLLPGYVCRVDYTRLSAGSEMGSAGYDVKVTITGLRGAADQQANVPDSLREGQPGVDW